MPKTVLIRVSKETRERLHAIKNPGQTLDGILTQLIDSWLERKAGDKEQLTTKEKYQNYRDL